ncbi:MAG: isoprenyl transferase [Candidatus Omnitrophica bacterium]|nr:isoprenyl transferase [Candidatus Omnitrophota bacterium]
MIDRTDIPRHVAIIMDGNGRWAKEKNLPRTAGHKVGIDRIKEIIRAADEAGIKVITFFAFSTENWSRPRREIDMLMRSLDSFLNREINELIKKNIRLLVIGRDDPIPGYLQKKLKVAQEKTKNNSGLTAVLALNYGSRQEIVEAAKRFFFSVKKGENRIEDLDTEKFDGYLFTAGLPDPDLLVRTSGEMRISNFLLWQLSYAELYFPRKYWPDFKKEDLVKAIKVYQTRERRFGAIKEK